MKALTKTNPGYDQMELLDMEEPKATKNFVKIKVEYSGICGSDLHSFKGEYGNIKTPVVLGHEFSGTVVEIGEDVKTVKVGDRVTSETTFETCGTCDYCKSKDYNLCTSRRGIGTQVNGSFAEYVLSREESVHVLPENVSFLEASLTEPLACCVHAALEKTSIDKEDVVLILGPGPIGLLLAQVVKSQGAQVILSGVTKDKDRLEFGKKLGVDVVVDSLQEDLEKIVMKKTNGYGVNKAFDCSGAVPAVNQGLRLIKKKGEFVQVGLFANVENLLDQEAIIQREIKYIGCRSQKPSSWIKSLDLMKEKKVDTEALITKIVDLKEWRRGIEAAMEGSELKVVIRS